MSATDMFIRLHVYTVIINSRWNVTCVVRNTNKTAANNKYQRILVSAQLWGAFIDHFANLIEINHTG